MEKILYFFIHLVVPTILVYLVVKNKSKSKIHLAACFGLYISIISFLCFWGQWPLVGSYYLRYVLIAIILLLSIYLIKGLGSSIPIWPVNFKRYFIIVPISLMAIFILLQSLELYNGRKYNDEGVALEFPLKNGKFYIASGGSNKLVNNHFRDFPNSQQFALDINKLGKYGGAYKNIFSSQSDNHHIYAETVYAPCSGQIVNSQNSIEDNSTSSMEVDSKNGKGNFVTINCDGILVSLFHLKKNSLSVSENINLYSGQPIGLVGNSGFSQEPHLHVQAAKYNLDSVLVGIPMVFKNRHWSRNNVIVN